jgi:hypothetical protein
MWNGCSEMRERETKVTGRKTEEIWKRREKMEKEKSEG